ncbi:hypothetical protein HOLleu_00387 [Holothuria leucospilota]|uniref:Uncharacterized protein n=1 Tax=Holothuria leucospilota TaxID=206669 RepID=A0A9Q1CP17_HOLLE|nr:hypothetical protein HOLleu_00387 [Holothuria leucospilota]
MQAANLERYLTQQWAINASSVSATTTDNQRVQLLTVCANRLLFSQGNMASLPSLWDNCFIFPP